MSIRMLKWALIAALAVISGGTIYCEAGQPRGQGLQPAHPAPAPANPAPIHPATVPPTIHPTTRPVAVTQPSRNPTTLAATRPTTAAVAVVPLNPAPPTTDPTEIDADAQLAERIASVAQSSLPPKVPSNDLWDPIWKQMSAMLSAAQKLDPTNARIARLQLDAVVRLHDPDQIISALNAAAKADTNDQFVQIQIVDSYAQRMETADAKVKYLQSVLGLQQVAAPVRAHAGVVAASFLLERGQPDAAKRVLGEALRLNPLSGEGLRLRYAMLPADAPNFERATALMAILRANPLQADYAAMLADQIAAAGLSDDSVTWYRQAINLSFSQGRPDFDAVRNCAIEMMLSDQAPEAANLMEQLTKAQPENSANWFVRLAILRFLGDKDDFQPALGQAINVMCNHLVEAVNLIGGTSGPAPTTRPIISQGPYPLPELALTVAQVNQHGTRQAKAIFEQALLNLSMLDTYFAEQPDAAAGLLDALGAVMPDNSPQLARLQGWCDLIAGKPDQAKAKFTPIAAIDPMAELGLIKLMAANVPDQPIAAIRGRRLLAQYPAGLNACIIWEALRDLHIKVIPSGQADALKSQIDRFPKQLLNIASQPQDFYAVHAEPINVARRYAEPLLARLTIQNLTDNDLTIGPDGMIQRGLVFSATIRGVQDQSFAGTAFDQIAGPLVLPARQSTSQEIRLDQGPLRQYLLAIPTVAMEVYGSVMTNPSAGPKETLIPGPAGYAVQFTRVFSRTATPVNSPQLHEALGDWTDFTPREKFDALELLGKFTQAIEASKQPSTESKELAVSCFETIRRAQNDPLPAVSAWASYITCILDSSGRMPLLKGMIADPDWRHRELGLAALAPLPLDMQKPLAAQLTDDPEPCVRAHARAALELIAVAAKLPPSSQPTTPPAAAHPSEPSPSTP